jgi:hypothetical protein
MIKHVRELRPLEMQFGKQTVRRIRAIQGDLEKFPFQDGAGRFFVKELSSALEAGLLLASLHLATSLLELFVRDLLIYSVAKRSFAGHKSEISVFDKLEANYEDATNPQWSFSMIIDELQRQRVISNVDAKTVKAFYHKIRIPIHHGLTRRFLRGNKKPDLESNSIDIMEMLFLGRGIRAHVLEETLESEGINLIKKAVAFMKKYSANVS